MSAGSVVLIGGGARSGKSRFALARARSLGERRVFVATAQAFDGEMDDRIALHRAERGADFTTVEEPLELAGALRAQDDADVVLAERRCHAVLVTNEVGFGIVPDNALARTFRDVAGRAHQSLARIADEIHVAILGSVLRLRPGPVEAVVP